MLIFLKTHIVLALLAAHWNILQRYLPEGRV